MATPIGTMTSGVTNSLSPLLQDLLSAGRGAGNVAANSARAAVSGVNAALPAIPPVVGTLGGVAASGGLVDLGARGVTAGLNNLVGPGDAAVEKAQSTLNAGTWRANIPNWLDQAGRGAAIGAHALVSGNSISDPIYSLGEPAAPPNVVGQIPARRAGQDVSARAGQDVSTRAAQTIANTPLDSESGATPLPAVTPPVTSSLPTTLDAPASQAPLRIGATPSAMQTPPPVEAPSPPAMNKTIMNQQQALMSQIADAQEIMRAGTDRYGYKMGDITRALDTMQALAPLVSSSNNLLSSTYGTDAGVLSRHADNVVRTDIANAGNATEMAKTNLAGQYGIAGQALTAKSAAALAEQKAQLEAMSPAGRKAYIEAATAARNYDDTAELSGAERVRAVLGRTPEFQQVKDALGTPRGQLINGTYVPFSDAALNQIAPPTKKK